MDVYDYIVVGAGSAGCVVADRLTAGGRHRVLLLEAGGTDRRFYVQMPLGYGKTFYDAAVNWNYRAEPDPGLAGNADHWPRGRIVGGSSSINAMVWIRGHPRDFDDWKAAGNPGWGWDDLLPVFRAVEDNEAGEDHWRARGGPVRVADMRGRVHPLTRRYLRAAAQAGLPLIEDFNGATQEGAGIYQITVQGGRRMSAARAFLAPAMRRPNLRVETGCHVGRIVLDGCRAIGVDYVQDGAAKTARAAGEVIVCAGSVGSPQLLELSGIGDPAVLVPLGIEPRIANANVGAHLQDHQGINYTWKARVPSLNQVLRPWWGKALAGLQYLAFRRGPLSMSMNQGGGFFRTEGVEDRPNMQLYFQAFSTVLPRPGERPILSPDPWPGFSIGLSNCRPSSRGTIHVRSADFREHPRIVANAFSTERDVAEMLDAVKFLRRIAAQPALAEIVAEEMLPGPSVTEDEDLVLDFRRRSGTVYHPVSTCRMGPDPSSSVVDPRLRVHGVEALRVIDASVFPNNVSGNTNAAAIVTGWKGAELALEDAR